ncbi:MAG: alkaline phosphatase family protein [Acidobacteriota bacterium]
MKLLSRTTIIILGTGLLLLGFPSFSEAYIGPGAGFAFLTSFFILFLTFIMAFFSLISWPFRFLFRSFRRKKVYARGKYNRLIIIGLDGLDPSITEQMMSQGELPNFARLKKEGTFARLKTTFPAISPVAWSSFLTGVTPARHNIFDFLSRDPRTYLPDLSSARIGRPSRTLPLGKYLIPLSKPEITLLRKSKPFWNILADEGVFSTILRVPITFPPERLSRGFLLSAMCIPDLRGSQGTFSFYSTDPKRVGKYTAGVLLPITINNDKINTFIIGPNNSLTRESKELKLSLTISLNRNEEKAHFQVAGQRFTLSQGQYSDWVRLTFKPGLGLKVRGICRFLITQFSPHFELYVTPINIDPEKPALPISYPFIYSVYLSKLLGNYATLGLPEDTWALNEGVIDDRSFLEQSYLIHEERRRMLLNTLEKTRRGMVVCVFDTTDRIQHMFWRYMDHGHPAMKGKNPEVDEDVIEELYRRMDKLIGEIMGKIGEDDLLMVVSDHGFKSFRRGVNLNSWLYMNGYLSLKNGRESREWFRDVDWHNTRAYALGLGGIYLNLKGRESQGIVQPGSEAQHLKEELVSKLSRLKDEKNGKVAINEVFDTASLYSGPYLNNAPDLIVGYNEGYRASWDGVTGKVNEAVFEDNVKKWSGDHCIDPRLVPGVFFCNHKINAPEPRLIDIAPTALDIFGVSIPRYMDGKSLMDSSKKVKSSKGK